MRSGTAAGAGAGVLLGRLSGVGAGAGVLKEPPRVRPPVEPPPGTGVGAGAGVLRGVVREGVWGVVREGLRPPVEPPDPRERLGELRLGRLNEPPRLRPPPPSPLRLRHFQPPFELEVDRRGSNTDAVNRENGQQAG